MYLIEGRKTLFRVALAILKVNEKAILNEQNDDMLYFVIQKGHTNVKDFQQLQNAMLAYTFSHTLIDHLERDYNKKLEEGYEVVNL